MGKYDPLMMYLDKSGRGELVLSYKEIESIIGDKLPVTSYRKTEWWSNNDATHSQSSAWSDVGYKTCNIILGKSITFRKNTI